MGGEKVMITIRVITYLLLIFLLTAWSICSGDIVYLTSGGKLTGTVVEETNDYIKLKLDSGGVMRLERKLVKNIEYTVIPDAKKAIAEAERLQEEGEIAAAKKDWATAVVKYGEAIRQCNLVAKGTGELFTKASALSLQFKEQLTSARKELMERGDEQLDLGNHKRAASYYKATIVKGDKEHTRKIGEKIVAAYLALADTCFDKKDYEKSIEYYRECLTFAPGNPQIRKKLARAKTYLDLIRADTLFAQAGKYKGAKRYSVALDKYAEVGRIYKELLGEEEALDQILEERISLVKENAGMCQELISASLELPAIWTDDYEIATKSAKKYKRPILVNFTGSDWCGWCKKLKREVFSRQSFKDYASKNLVLLEIDFPRSKTQSQKVKTQNQTLARKYGIRGYPTIILIDGNGNEIARTGYREGGPGKYVEHLKRFLSR